MSKIGIKLANGEFYPVLAYGTPARKRLVLTTVSDMQKSVQIDLYNGSGPTVESGEYIGSLVVENIPEKPAGEPDIRLELELDSNGNLNCAAREPETGAVQSIRVSMETLSEENSYQIPDFDLDQEETDTLPSEATSPEEGAGLLAAADEYREKEGKSHALLWIFGILVLLLVGAILWWFFLRGLPAAPAADTGNRKPVATVAATPPPPAQPAPKPAKAVTPAPAPAPAKTVTAPAPAPATTVTAAAPQPEAIPAGGKRYRIKWGDTLWDLAWANYRNPWLYPRIAKANGIRNPNHIISGTWIVIPPR